MELALSDTMSYNGTCSDTSSEKSSSDKSSTGKSLFNRNLDSIINGKAGKMFVGGLSQDSTVAALRFYFAQFGEIEECTIMRDAKTKLSRGFAFVTYVDPASIAKVLEVSEHFLDGKKIDPQPAIRSISPARSVHNIYKKLFIGGVSQQTSIEDLRQYFTEHFGTVEDVVLKVDYPKKTHRGFGFLTFEDESVADVVCEIRYHVIHGKTVETKQAQKKEFINLNANNATRRVPTVPPPVTNFNPLPIHFVKPSGFWSAPVVADPVSSFFPVLGQCAEEGVCVSAGCAESKYRKRLVSKYMSRVPPTY